MAFIGITFQKAPSTFLGGKYSVLEFTIISVPLCIRNKSAKKMLNRSGLKIKPCGTPNITASHTLFEILTLIFCFPCGK